MSNTVLYDVRDRVAYVTLNRPDVLNAMNNEMRQALAAACHRINEDPEVLVGVIAGAGERAFSTGADLKDMARSELDVQNNRTGSDDLPAVAKPLIAAIHGFCVAGGFELALRCDIRIATPDAQFGLPEARWSLMAGYGLHNLSRMVPLGEALYMQLTGERITAQRAHEIGLVQKLVPREQLMAEAVRVAGLIAGNAPLAVQGIKKVVMTGRQLPVAQSWQFGLPIEKQVYASEDFKEGPKAFTEKRKPHWTGR